MISEDFLAMLRCPLDPARQALLAEADNALWCQRCWLKFPIKEGIPCVLVEEAELPEGCSDVKGLPCQQAPAGLKREGEPGASATGGGHLPSSGR